MKRLIVSLLLATALQAQSTAQRVYEDAIAFDRIGAVAKKDLPKDVMRRLIDEDVEVLRGKRPDGTYQYASFERFDSGRTTKEFSVHHRGEEMEVFEIKGEWVYRVQIEVPSRKLLVRKNRPVWIERVDLDYLSETGSQTERTSIEVKQWLKPGEFRPVDFPQVARQATAKVVASVEKDLGYGNIELALIKAKIVDNADSPYGEAVAHAKAIQRALDNSDVASMRTSAQRMRDAVLRSGAIGLAVPQPAPIAVQPAPAPAQRTDPQLRDELQTIEDLLTGTEQERREGMDRLHQLLRKLRQAS